MKTDNSAKLSPSSKSERELVQAIAALAERAEQSGLVVEAGVLFGVSGLIRLGQAALLLHIVADACRAEILGVKATVGGVS